MKKKYMPYILALLAFLAFLFIPFHRADILFRIWVTGMDEELMPEEFVLYYATETSGFSQEQTIHGDYDKAHDRVTFRINAALADQITLLRIDFPNETQVLNIYNVTSSSGGVIKRQYNPCNFFSEENITAQSGLYALDLVPRFAHAYIGTTGDDPYVVLSDGLSRNIVGCSDRFLLIKILISAYLGLCSWLYEKSFRENEK